jgi:hypothetical protein
MAAIFIFYVKMRLLCTTNVTFGILGAELQLKEVSHKFVSDLVQKLAIRRFRSIGWQPSLILGST